MNKVISLKCENCGANMILTSEGFAKCEYCGMTVLNAKKEKSSRDYVIRAGVLEKYAGASAEIEIPDGVSVIGKNAFENLYSIVNVRLPETVVKIDDYAFSGCEALKNINFPSSLKYIGKHAFKGSGITEVVIDSSLEHIGEGAFMECSELTMVKIAADLPKNCSKVFKHCKKLFDVEISVAAFAQSFKPSMEAKKQGDIRPTYFDFFQGTPYYSRLCDKYSQNICLCCGESIEAKMKCENCGAVYYDRDNIGFKISAMYHSIKCGFKGKQHGDR